MALQPACLLPHLFFTQVQAICQCSCHWLTDQLHCLQASKFPFTTTGSDAGSSGVHSKVTQAAVFSGKVATHTCEGSIATAPPPM